MNLYGLKVVLEVILASYAIAADVATTLTTDPAVPGKSIYLPSAGAAASSVAAPSASPTLVYNCYNMPLICENVASYVKKINPGGTGDLASALTLYFDPSDSNKDNRRQAACGCFSHDTCPSQTSNGKRAGMLVSNIAIASAPVPLLPISPANVALILAGTNPAANALRAALPAVPGRFFKEGIAFTCDEFPAAPFIEGGSNAEKICALQSWQVFQGSPVVRGNVANVGKYNLPPSSGVKQEQDWQALSHAALRVSRSNLRRINRDIILKASRNSWASVETSGTTPESLREQAQYTLSHLLLQLSPNCLPKLISSVLVLQQV